MQQNVGTPIKVDLTEIKKNLKFKNIKNLSKNLEIFLHKIYFFKFKL